MDRVWVITDGSHFQRALKDAGLSVNDDFGRLGAKLTGPGRRCIGHSRYRSPLTYAWAEGPEDVP